MGSVSGDSIEWDAHQDSSAHEEKIFVSIRLRPLNERELGKNDVSDWDCINNTTIIFKNSFQERSMHPAAYTFDRVFGPDSPTRKVYEESAKRIALSVLSGMNSSIFAYGQTSSGKTYTMCGITQYALEDIFDYIWKHPERDFVLKFSAMEIYNESVRDLLVPDGVHLRLLDDPERGTIVDKLTEVTLRDSNHLKELLSVCESQRQVGETSLNEMSSRSHQILRLTVESEARTYLGAENASTLTASVNFVDLAGSERASQTMSAGTRLKEGSHINRSLLTLGTVIRKLSKGRNGHIPYRNSKLTRILQNSLGGNARTSIICTMSPAHVHVEQSRNTLLFASCAKQVSMNAQVNVVMSEKALVKHLQRELARLENELRNLSSLATSGGSSSALKEKEELIEKMDKEIRELTYQRNLAQSRVENVLKSGGAKSWVDMNNYEKASWTDEYPASEASEIIDPLRSDVASVISRFSDGNEGNHSRRIEDMFPDNNEEQFLSNDTSPGLYIDKYFGPDPLKGWEKIAEVAENLEDNCKEVQCIEIDFSKTNTNPDETSPDTRDQGSEEDVSDPSTNVKRSRSCVAILTTIEKSQESEMENMNEEDTDKNGDNQEELSKMQLPTASEDKCFQDSQGFQDNQEEVSKDSISSNAINGKEENVKPVDEDLNAEQKEACVIEIDEVVKPKLVKQIEEDLDLEKPVKNSEKVVVDVASKKDEVVNQPESDWRTEFERQQREIIELWATCNIPLLHRSYFFLLFKGDPSDAVYMEVELRRLSFLKNALHGVHVVKDDQFLKEASSAKALIREREMLSRKLLKKFSGKERESLFKKWGIDLKSKKRRLQLCRRLWTDTSNMEHIKESASIVAKLVGFKEPGQAPKEMFGLSFSQKPANSRSYSHSWRHSLPSIV